MRKKERNSQKIIISKLGKDASDVTLKNQAIATSVTHTSYTSRLNVDQTLPQPFVTQVNYANTDSYQNTHYSGSLTCDSGVVTTASGRSNVDTANTLIQAAQFAAYSNVYGVGGGAFAVTSTIIPCGLSNIVTSQISTLGITPGQPQLLRSSGPGFASPGIIYSNDGELIADQGRQANIRTRYNLPSKLTSLRGPIMNSI